MKTLIAAVLSTLAFALAVQGCARQKQNTPEQAALDPAPVLADNPNAHLSDVLQKMRGRWVKEIDDPNTANPPMMRLFAVDDNTLSGRMMFAGAFADVGVAATLVQNGTVFTLTLSDDDLRPHDWVPPTRVLTGEYDSTTKTLELKSKDGSEYMSFTLPGGYAIKFTGNVYHCVVVPGASGPSGSSGASGASGATGTPTTGPSGDDGSIHHGSGHHAPLAALDELMADLDLTRPIVIPTPHPGTPTSKIMACGIMSSYEENWSRMSGAGG